MEKQFESVRKDTNLNPSIRTMTNILGDEYYIGIERFLKPSVFAEGESLGDNGSPKVQKLVVFMTRRLSCLAYLYMRREIKYQQPSNVRYLTNSGLINAAEWVAEQLSDEKAQWPKIEIIDDSLSYGRAIVNILNIFKNTLEQCLMKRIGNSCEEIIKKYIKGFVSIRIYMGKERNDLLPDAYKDILNIARREEDCTWNDFSNRVSELIGNADVANAAFILSAKVDELPEKCDGWESVEKIYKKKKETVFFKPFYSKDGNRLTAMAAIRCFRCAESKAFRIVPFVFLPDMGKEQFEKLEKQCNFSEKFAEVFADSGKELNFTDGKSLRNRHEFVTMYLSQSLLMCFCDAAQLKLSDYDCDKIKWNYDDLSMKRVNRRDLLTEKNLENRSLWMEMSAIEELFSKEDCPDIQAIKENFQMQQCNDVSRSEDETFLRLYEDYVFCRGIEAEKEAKDMIREPIAPSEWQRVKRDPERRKTLTSILEELRYLQAEVEQVGEVRAIRKELEFISVMTPRKKVQEPQKLKTSLFDFLAYTLQLMDAGLLSIVLRVKEDDAYKSCDTESRTLVQQVRFCEQAQAVLMKKYYRHLDALNALFKEFDWTQWGINRDFVRVLDEQIEPAFGRYLQSLQAGINEDLGQMSAEEMCSLLFALKASFQVVEDWTQEMGRHYYVDENGDCRSEAMSEQALKARCYGQYLLNRKKILYNI